MTTSSVRLSTRGVLFWHVTYVITTPTLIEYVNVRNVYVTTLRQATRSIQQQKQLQCLPLVVSPTRPVQLPWSSMY